MHERFNFQDSNVDKARLESYVDILTRTKFNMKLCMYFATGNKSTKMAAFARQ